jgi:ATP-dependent Clp protease adaptor protein ClpS
VPKIKEASKVELDTIEPTMYKVIIHNDDYTPIDFVVGVLITIFNKCVEEANEITWQIHEKGKGIGGLYVKEIAATKAHQVIQKAKAEGFPLLATIEPEG